MWTYNTALSAQTIYGDSAWIDYNFPVSSLGRGASPPDFIQLSSTGIYVAGFDGVNTVEQVFGSIEMNHNWAEGTVIKPHVHWLPSSAAAGNVKWYLTYTLTQDGDVEPSSTTISVTTATNSTAWENLRSDFPDIVTTGKVIGAQFSFRFYRDPDDDTYAADAAAKTIGLHVQVNSLGSRQVGIK
jgi:hypothetical protein